MTIPFIDYNIATDSTLPPISGKMKEYWLASNGVFVRAARKGLNACIPVANCSIAGLAALTPYVHLTYPQVPTNIVNAMLSAARSVGETEILFYLSFVNDSWQLNIPEQVATTASVKPLTALLGTAYETALVEVHSHHSMNARFSPLDDLEESGKFRIFAVFGEIFNRPTINVRIGIYSHFWQIPARWIFDLPIELTDLVGLCN